MYQILGVRDNATPQEIKKAYKVLSNKFHPDKPGGDPEMFKQLKEAYDTLKDPDKRAHYDKTGQVLGPEVDLYQQGMTRIIMYMESWYAKGDLVVDPVDTIKSDLANDLYAIRQEISNCAISKDFIARARKRLSAKGDDFLSVFFDNKIRDIENLKDNSEKKKLVTEKAIIMIEDFSWEEIENAYRQISFNTGGSTTSGTSWG